VITCTRCGDIDGPFDPRPEGTLCEDCAERQDGQQ